MPPQGKVKRRHRRLMLPERARNKPLRARRYGQSNRAAPGQRGRREDAAPSRPAGQATVNDQAWRHMGRWLLVLLGLTLIPALYTVLTAGGGLASHLTHRQIFVTACLELVCVGRDDPAGLDDPPAPHPAPHRLLLFANLLPAGVSWWPRSRCSSASTACARRRRRLPSRRRAGTRTRSRRCRRSGSNWNQRHGQGLMGAGVPSGAGSGIRAWTHYQLSRDRERQAVRLEASLSEARLQAPDATPAPFPVQHAHPSPSSCTTSTG